MNYYLKILSIISLMTFSQVAISAPTETLTILAAASLTNVLPKVADAWNTKKNKEIIFSFEATSRLAQQVKAGVVADLFFSADQEWMDNLDQENKIEKDSRTTLLSNRIVLIVPTDSTFVPKSSAELLDPKIKHLALAGETVPAGKFARAALKSEGQLEKIQSKIVSANNVRAALQWVALKEAEAGIVFQTDAKIQSKVKIAFQFPESSHPKIEYPMAIIKGSKNLVLSKSFMDFCKTNEAKKIFESEGFIVLGK